MIMLALKIYDSDNDDVSDDNQNLIDADMLKLFIKIQNINWSIRNWKGDTAFDILAKNKVALKIVVGEFKSFISKMMIRKSDDREITKTPLIFALENNLDEHIFKILEQKLKKLLILFYIPDHIHRLVHLPS